MTGLLQSQHKTLMDVVTYGGAKKVISNPVEDVKTVEMTTKDSDYCIKLVDKEVAKCERTKSSFERSLIVGKISQTTLYVTKKLFIKGRINRCGKLHCVILRNCHSHPNLWQPRPLFLSVTIYQCEGKTLQQQSVPTCSDNG